MRLPGGRKALAGVVVVAAVVAGGVAVATGGESSGGSNDLVITAEAQRRTLTDSITVKGTVGRVEQRRVAAATASQVSAVHIEDGTEIRAGDAVLALDGRDAVAEEGDFPFFRALDVGSKGQDVRQLEAILDRAGFHPGPIDDVYTTQTRSALAQWQATRGYPGASPERAETVTVSLSQSGGYTVGGRGSAGVTIRPAGADAAAPPVVRLAALQLASTGNPRLSIHALDAVTTEGAPATFRIDAEDPPDDALEVELEASGPAGDDDAVVPAVVTFPAGTRSLTVSVPTRQDRQIEGEERLVVTLVDRSGYTVGRDDEASTVILDDDVPELALSGSATVAEGATATLTITADQAPGRDTQVGLTVGGDATPGTDFGAVDTVALLRAGSSSATVAVPTRTDDLIERDEQIVVSLAAGGTNYRVGPMGTAVVTVTGAPDDDPRPTLTMRATATSVAEGQPFPLTVSIDRPTTEDLVLDLRYGGDARAGDDFAPLGRTVLPAGQTSLALQVPTVQDDRVEADRTLEVVLAPSPRYGLSATAGGTATIESDDVPELTLLPAPTELREGNRTSFTVVADQAPVEDLSVSYSATGSATAGDDFDALTGSAVLRSGTTSVTVPLVTLADDVTFVPTDMIVGRWPIRVGQVAVDTGESVAAGAELLSLTDSGLTVTLRASASDRTRLSPGQEVKVTISGGSSEVAGVISTLDETAKVDEKTNDQYYEGTVDVADLQAADGSNVSIEVVLEQELDALTVPIAAVKQDGQGRDVVRVLELDRGGKITEVVVTTGLSEGSYIEVESGLEPGDVVIVEIDEQ